MSERARSKRALEVKALPLPFRGFECFSEGLKLRPRVPRAAKICFRVLIAATVRDRWRVYWGGIRGFFKGL